ncbi:unnamed protein product [Effrenium voratum]|uniref:Peptidase C1A papain C-terminal domain-containing protein n=1 Tax=Effrenium voratum TaxID=2562239 RepID=A0AA36JBH8_9DINO|nr:unnamed protein product [Effrenium voratum]
MQLAEGQRYPTTFSWLYEKPQCLDYVHHQGTCGCCYMFAALDSLSDRHCIDTTKASSLGVVEHLSVQMALLCEPLGRQCAGGWADVGFNYTVYHGLQPASLWPYERSCLSDSECQFGKQCFSPSSYACPGFFAQDELDEVSTFSDALRVAKSKCESSNLEDPDNCKVWAETMFAYSPTMVFMPETCFCAELEDDWAKFTRKDSEPPCDRRSGHMDGSGVPSILMEGQAQKKDDKEEGFNFFTWLFGLFGGGGEKDKESEKKEAEVWDSNIPGGKWSADDKDGASGTTRTTTTVESSATGTGALARHSPTSPPGITTSSTTRMSSRWRSTTTAPSTPAFMSMRTSPGSSSSGQSRPTTTSGAACRAAMPWCSSAGRAAAPTTGTTASPFRAPTIR